MARKAATDPQEDKDNRKNRQVELSMVSAPDREAQAAAVESILPEQRHMSAELQGKSPGQEEFTTRKRRVEGICVDAPVISMISRTKMVTFGAS